MPRRRSTIWVVLLGASLSGCDLSKAPGSSIECLGPSCAGAGSGDGTPQEMPQPSGSVAPPNDVINPLCGIGTCLPDSETACTDRDVNDFLSGGGGVDGGASYNINPLPPIVDIPDASLVIPVEDGGTDGGVEGEEPNGSGGHGGMSSNAPEARPEGELGGSETEVTVACRLSMVDGEATRACGLAGAGEELSPCTSARDCGPGLGCVGSARAGRCLPFCCAGQKACSDTSYCAELPLVREDADGESPLAPVCSPAQGCNLDEQYPCPEGASCSCGAGTVCTPVSDGLRTCLPPGDGTRGEACPCAPGHFCSPVSARCEKLCDPSNSSSGQCGADMCQESQELRWGVCVGASP